MSLEEGVKRSAPLSKGLGCKSNVLHIQQRSVCSHDLENAGNWQQVPIWLLKPVVKRMTEYEFDY